MNDTDVLVIITNENKELKNKIKKLEKDKLKLQFKINILKNLYYTFENFFTLTSGFIIISTIVGIFLEKFQYIYDGFFNKYGIVFLIIGLIILGIPYFLKEITLWLLKMKKKRSYKY